MSSPRMTSRMQLVLRALVQEPTRLRHGPELSETVGLSVGIVYPLLARLERIHWLESGWEGDRNWPRRRHYRLTSDGAEQARLALAQAHQSRLRSAATWGRSPNTGEALR